MACAHYAMKDPSTPAETWAPPALREAECLLRRTNPEKWAKVLQEHGVEVSVDDISCTRNLDGDWEDCPLYVERGRKKTA